MKTITQETEEKKKTFYRFTFADPHTLTSGLAGWIYGDKLVTQVTANRLWSIFGLTRYKITVEYVTLPPTTVGDARGVRIYAAGDNPLGRLLSLVLLLLAVVTTARATPATDYAAQVSYLRNQRAAAAHNLTIAEGQLTAAQQRLANLPDKRTRQLEEWTVWNAGKCAVRGHLSLAEAQSQPCKPAPRVVYHEQRPTGPEVVTPNPARLAAQRAVEDATSALAQGRAALAALDTRLAAAEAQYRQALATPPPPPPPPTLNPHLNPHLPTVTSTVALTTDPAPAPEVVSTPAPAPAPEEVTPPEPSPSFFRRYRYWLAGGLLLVLGLAYMLRNPTV